MCLQARAQHVQPFGCFASFDLDHAGQQCKVFGMVHQSEVSWGRCDDVNKFVQVSLPLWSFRNLACQAHCLEVTVLSVALTCSGSGDVLLSECDGQYTTVRGC